MYDPIAHMNRWRDIHRANGTSGGKARPKRDLAQYHGGADEYEILLSTGGPALRIWGRLDQYSQPETAELQMQDWGTPWTRYPAPEATLLAFAACFYFEG